MAEIPFEFIRPQRQEVPSTDPVKAARKLYAHILLRHRYRKRNNLLCDPLPLDQWNLDSCIELCSYLNSRFNGKFQIIEHSITKAMKAIPRIKIYIPEVELESKDGHKWKFFDILMDYDLLRPGGTIFYIASADKLYHSYVRGKCLPHVTFTNAYADGIMCFGSYFVHKPLDIYYTIQNIESIMSILAYESTNTSPYMKVNDFAIPVDKNSAVGLVEPTDEDVYSALDELEFEFDPDFADKAIPPLRPVNRQDLIDWANSTGKLHFYFNGGRYYLKLNRSVETDTTFLGCFEGSKRFEINGVEFTMKPVLLKLRGGFEKVVSPSIRKQFIESLLNKIGAYYVNKYFQIKQEEEDNESVIFAGENQL